MKKILAMMLCLLMLASGTAALADSWFIQTTPAQPDSFTAVEAPEKNPASEAVVEFNALEEAVQVYYVKTTGNVNLRKGPGLGYGTVGSVGTGVELEYRSETSYDDRGVAWYKVAHEGAEVWISSKYAELDEAAMNEYGTYVRATAHVNVRSGPSGSYEDLGTLEKGEQVEYLGVSANDANGVAWHKIQYYSYFEGWVCSTYCELVQGNTIGVPEQNSGVTGSYVKATDGKSNLRTGPGLGYKDIATIPNGESATYLGRYSVDERGVTWYYVQFDGEAGWVSSRYTTLY